MSQPQYSKSQRKFLKTLYSSTEMLHKVQKRQTAAAKTDSKLRTCCLRLLGLEVTSLQKQASNAQTCTPNLYVNRANFDFVLKLVFCTQDSTAHHSSRQNECDSSKVCICSTTTKIRHRGQQQRSSYKVHLLWLPARLRAEGGRGVGDPRPGLTGRLRGGEATVMPLASSLGASHVAQSVMPFMANSCKQVHQLKLQQAAGH